MDTSATELLKTPEHPGDGASEKGSFFRCNRSLKGSMAIFGAVFLATISLGLTGCSFMKTVQAAATEMTTAAPEVGPYDAPQPGSPKMEPETPFRPAQPAPQTAQRASEIKPAPKPTPRPAPVTVSRGAEQLMTQNSPGVMRVNARTVTPEQPVAASQAKAPTTGAVTGGVTTTDAAVTGLIFKGPPREAKAGHGGKKVWIGLLLVICSATAGVLIRLHGRRRTIVMGGPSASDRGKEKDVNIPGLKTKEPIEQEPAAEMAEKS